MDQKLPSERLTAPSRRAPWIIASVLAVAVTGSAFVFGPAVAAQLAPAPTATATAAPADTGPVLTAEELASIQQAADDQQAKIAADKQKADDEAAARAAAAAAAAAASRDTNRQSNAGGLPAGAVVPLNGFGSPDTTKCASGSASDNADGVAVCD